MNTSSNTPQNAPILPNHHALPDIQDLPDERGIGLQHVGVRQVAMPLKIVQKDGRLQHVQSRASLSVSLGQETKGTHMSRMIALLTQWSEEHAFGLDLESLLQQTKARLLAPAAEVEMAFEYFIQKPAPVSRISAPMAYRCFFKGTLDALDEYRLILGIVVPVTTLCPCSKAISKYGAHNQRADLRCEIVIDPKLPDRVVWIEDLIEQLETTASCPLYPMLKREDEKYVTERAYENPKFVEDVVRDATLLLRAFPGILGFSLHVEALESIHDHNAWAAHREAFPVQ